MPVKSKHHQFFLQILRNINDYLFSYQYGPDTYLLQVKDPDFPARLREYLNVAKQTSAEFQDVKVTPFQIP